MFLSITIKIKNFWVLLSSLIIPELIIDYQYTFPLLMHTTMGEGV
jgi:hypothetical protein